MGHPARFCRPAGLAVYAAFAAYAAACLSLLVACGPGLGGTGTGPSVDPLTAFNASAVPVCSSELAAALQCPAATTGAPALGGTAVVGYAAGAGNTRVLARFDGDRVDVQWPCQGQRFVGQWAFVAGQPARFFGVLEQAGQAPLLVSLTAQKQGDAVQLQLFDAAGLALGDARLLTRLAVVPPAGAAVCI
jgi:hypothetical protein